MPMERKKERLPFAPFIPRKFSKGFRIAASGILVAATIGIAAADVKAALQGAVNETPSALRHPPKSRAGIPVPVLGMMRFN